VISQTGKKSISSTYMPQWRERVLQDPYFSYNDWLFSLEALVIMDIPIQVPATAGTQALLGLLAGRTGTMFRTAILGVIGTADHPSLPVLTQDPRSVNPIVAKMAENETIFDF